MCLYTGQFFFRQTVYVISDSTCVFWSISSWNLSFLSEQIRLHIIAMHELCEYNKGEGFSEGFDAHLNIEQMNKTSVELFQMYDDHRRKGVFFSTEKEFRGYYALLKLDKHPGYKVR
jgi:hypothetical protein